MGALVLVGQPDSRNIMLIALAAPPSRETWWRYGDIAECLSRRVGGRAARWIGERAPPADVRLVETRAYIPLQTALYCSWLWFADESFAQAFLDAFRGHAVAERLRRLEAKRVTLATRLDLELAKGRFDLRALPPDRRRDAAQRFVKEDTACEQLGRDADLLRRAAALGEGWRRAVEADRLGPSDLSLRQTEPVYSAA